MRRQGWQQGVVLSALLCGLVTGSEAAPPLAVTSNADSGPGSFRDAIQQANGDKGIRRIAFAAGLDDIELASAVIYSGAQPLEIDGAGTTIAPAAGNGDDLFVANGGGHLALANLVFEDGSQEGVFVDIPASAKGVFKVSLQSVMLEDNGLHGMHVSDGADSPASISLTLQGVSILENGLLGVSDFDGIRVDETGDGDIVADFQATSSSRNGGDGIELDERGAGDVRASVADSSFDQNGPLDPADLEDGFDIDEIDDGSLTVTFNAVSASGNFDQGLDMNEAGSGDLKATFNRVTATSNLGDGLKTTEEDDGDSPIQVKNTVVTSTQEQDGLEFEQFGTGEIKVTVVDTLITDSDDAGIKIDADGAGELSLSKVSLLGNDDPQIEVSAGVVVKIK